MRVTLLPRLNELGVMKILEDAKDLAPTRSQAFHTLDQHESFVWFAPSGGSWDRKAALMIVDEIRKIAENFGFPETTNQKSRSEFDTALTKFLALRPELSTGEALRDDVWAFMTSILAPEVVAWRFPDRSVERFTGGVRNAFQRLWVRGVALDLGKDHPDRWKLVESLSEDGMVQIFERASIARDQRLTQAIATVWTETAERIGRGGMEEVMRKTTKMLRLRNEIVDLGFLPEDDLIHEVRSVFFTFANVPIYEDQSYAQ